MLAPGNPFETMKQGGLKIKKEETGKNGNCHQHRQDPAMPEILFNETTNYVLSPILILNSFKLIVPHSN